MELICFRNSWEKSLKCLNDVTPVSFLCSVCPDKSEWEWRHRDKPAVGTQRRHQHTGFVGLGWGTLGSCWEASAGQTHLWKEGWKSTGCEPRSQVTPLCLSLLIRHPCHAANSWQASSWCRELTCVEIKLRKEIFIHDNAFHCRLILGIWTLLSCWNCCVRWSLLCAQSPQFSKHLGLSVRHGLWLGPAWAHSGAGSDKWAQLNRSGRSTWNFQGCKTRRWRKIHSLDSGTVGQRHNGACGLIFVFFPVKCMKQCVVFPCPSSAVCWWCIAPSQKSQELLPALELQDGRVPCVTAAWWLQGQCCCLFPKRSFSSPFGQIR